MNTVIALLSVLLLLVFIYFVVEIIRPGKTGTASRGFTFPFGRQEKVTRQTKVYPARRNPHRATSIVNDQNPCSAVKKLLNVRFLDVDKRLPSLPVVGCNVGYCNCKYVRHEDRREEAGDRRAPGALTSDLYEQSGHRNKRSSKGGRRKKDFNRRQIQYSEFDNKG